MNEHALSKLLDNDAFTEYRRRRMLIYRTETTTYAAGFRPRFQIFTNWSPISERKLLV